jgi:hypothetical protein
MEDKIYILKGFTGRYSDTAEWIVAAFLSRENAEAYMEKVQFIADNKLCACGEENELDHQMVDFGTGISYSIKETELKDPEEF